MLKREEISANINNEYCITQTFQKETRYGLCRYISDICSSIEDLNNDIASIAMVYVNYFFIKKSYIEYEKLSIACASILLACKYQNIQGKFDQLCRRFSELNMKILGQNTTVIKAEDIHKIKEKISLAEVTLMKCLNFNINVDLPNEFIYVYSAILYPDNEDDVIQYSLKVASDSYFTYCNLLFKNYSVSIASILIAAKFLNLPSFLHSDFPHIKNLMRFHNNSRDEESFNKNLLNFENKSLNIKKDLDPEKDIQAKIFHNLPIYKKIHPFLIWEDLEECVKLILEYYDDVSANV